MSLAKALFCLLCSLGCAGFGRDPAAVLPIDALGYVVFSSPRESEEVLSKFTQTIPEAAGAVELVRSLSGINFASKKETEGNGLDGGRRPALALWEDAFLVVLPVLNEGLALRRLRLRLVRFGFALVEKSESREVFEHATEKYHAHLWGSRGLAFVCIGLASRCQTIREGSGWDYRQVFEELPDIEMFAVGLIRSQASMVLARQLGLSSAKAGFVASALQDIRWAVSLRKGLSFIALGGVKNGRLSIVDEVEAIPKGLVARVTAALPNMFVADLLPLKGWTGRGILWLLDKKGDEPLSLSLPEAFRRLHWFAKLEFWNEAQAEAAADDLLRLTRQFLGGMEIERKVEGNKVLLMSGKTTEDLGASEIRPKKEGAEILDVLISPRAFLEATGVGRIEYLRRMLGPIEALKVKLYLDSGRFVLYARAELR